MRDDAAKAIIWILGASFLIGGLVLGGHYLFTGQAYTSDYCLEDNMESGFYPYNPPKRSDATRSDRE